MRWLEATGVGETERDLHQVELPGGEGKGENRGERPGGPF